MEHYGDITKLSGYTLPYVDCICGGSPCQDLSVAGLKKGLSGERSGLFMEQVRIVKEMRERAEWEKVEACRFMVWENVQGAFSSCGGRDFQTVLTEIVRIVRPDAPDVPLPKGGKWPKAGCIMGHGEDGQPFSIGWRLHDSQFWGVPQRRNRLSLVADFAGYTGGSEVLFERESLCRNPQTGRNPWEETTGSTGSGTESTVRKVYGLMDRGKYQEHVAPLRARGGDYGGGSENLCVERAISFQERAGKPGGGKGILIQNDHTGAISTVNNQYVMEPIMIEMTSTKNTVVEDGISPTLTARMGTGGNQVNAVLVPDKTKVYGICSYSSNSMMSDNPHSGIYEADTARTLDLNGGNPACNQGGMVITETYQKVCGTIDCGIAKGTQNQLVDQDMFVTQKNTVRRLTPLECERLQGYPDGWTDIGDWVDSKGKTHKTSDSARYKALGNSIALPFWYWLMCRISLQYDRPAYMGSLFDGIGGFPLCWEECNGPGTALWASEIEEFPIAVTKVRFPEKEGDEDV